MLLIVSKPLEGFIKISNAPMRNALQHLNNSPDEGNKIKQLKDVIELRILCAVSSRQRLRSIAAKTTLEVFSRPSLVLIP